jgi:hypothetical protein
LTAAQAGAPLRVSRGGGAFGAVLSQRETVISGAGSFEVSTVCHSAE